MERFYDVRPDRLPSADGTARFEIRTFPFSLLGVSAGYSAEFLPLAELRETVRDYRRRGMRPRPKPAFPNWHQW